MKIVKAYPPNWSKLRQAFPYIKGARGIVYAWGGVIYNPDGGALPQEILAHEAVHGIRQEEVGIEKWWHDYSYVKAFRFEEEVLAHRAEYQEFESRHKTIVQRDAYLTAISTRLSSALYGNLVTPTEARLCILGIVPEKAEALRVN